MEEAIGTDALVADSDGDGVSDGDEVLNGSDPTSADSTPDGRPELTYPPAASFAVRVNIPDDEEGERGAPAGTLVEVLNLHGVPLTRAMVDSDGEANLVLPRALEPGQIVVFRAAPWDDPGAELLGLGFVPPFPLPVPDGDIDGDDLAVWQQNFGAAVEAFDPVRGFDPESGIVELSVDTTVVTATFATWMANALETAGRTRPRFPWESASTGPALDPSDIDYLEQPQGGALTAYDLTAVARQIYDLYEARRRFTALADAGRQMWESRLASDGASPPPLDVLMHLLAHGELLPPYDSVVAAPLSELIAHRDELLSAPEARAVEQVGGVLSQTVGPATRRRGS